MEEYHSRSSLKKLLLNAGVKGRIAIPDPCAVEVYPTYDCDGNVDEVATDADKKIIESELGWQCRQKVRGSWIYSRRPKQKKKSTN